MTSKQDVRDLIAAVKRTTWLLDEIRSGNSFSDTLLWHEIARSRDAAERAAKSLETKT